MVDVLDDLVGAIPAFATWSKQKRIVFLIWYYRQAFDVKVMKKRDLQRLLDIVHDDVDVWSFEIDGGGFFTPLIDGKRQKPLLERVGPGRYQLTRRGFEQFQRYESTLKSLLEAARVEDEASSPKSERPGDTSGHSTHRAADRRA